MITEDLRLEIVANLKSSGKTSTACEVKLRYHYLSKNWFGANKQLGLALAKGVDLDTELSFK